jgi:hypothetical protein
MGSDLRECHGALYNPLRNNEKVRTIMAPGSGVSDDGWWTNENLVDQFNNKVLPAFEALHPQCAAVFAFDNSMNHKKMPADGLDPARLNLSDGGKNERSRIRDGWVEVGGQIVAQSMVHADGTQKGVRTILQERGLWSDGTRLPDARDVLAAQPDFAGQKSVLEETILATRDEAGNGLHQVIFFPKFHCELNHIELYWAAAKRYSRANCDYSFAALRKTVPEALDSVPLQTIRKNARFCFRYMDAYRRGLSWELAKFATKRYRSHRRIPEGTTLQQIQAEFDACEQSQA